MYLVANAVARTGETDTVFFRYRLDIAVVVRVFKPCLQSIMVDIGDGKLGFYDITEAVCRTVEDMQYAKDKHTLSEIIECDRAARERIKSIFS